MRYTPDHKDESRRRIIRAAARRFRKDGISSVGVVPLMNDAGLTHGAFYSHFASKEALVEAVMAEGINDTIDRLAEAGKGGGLTAMVNLYLSSEHCDNPAVGCGAAALGSEIARHSLKSRRTYTRQVDRMVGLIEAALARPDRKVAQAIFGTMAGSLILARSVSDPELAKGFLTAGRAAALKLADQLSSPTKT